MPLTPEQRDIVQTTGKPLLVLAGPGTGKTEVLAQRILFLIKNSLATEEEIVGITFTTKAANQMKDRLKQLGLPENKHPLQRKSNDYMFQMPRCNYIRSISTY